MDKSYSHEKKKKLAEKIQSLERKHHKHIKKIIKENNPDSEFMKSTGSSLTTFQNLTYKTYIELDKYVTKVLDSMKDDKSDDSDEQLGTDGKTLSESLDQEITNMAKHKKISKKLRYTNTENLLLNRDRYEREIRKTNEDYDESQEKIEQYFPKEQHNDKSLFKKVSSVKKKAQKGKST